MQQIAISKGVEMSKKASWIAVSLLLVVGLLIGAFGCAPEAAPAPAPGPAPTKTVTKTVAKTVTTAPPPAQPETIEIKWAHMGSPEIPNLMWRQNRHIDWIAQATGGKGKVEIFWGDTLLAMTDYYKGLQEGIHDFGYFLPGVTPGLLPLHNLFSLPGLWLDCSTDHAVVMELYEKYPQFEESIDPRVVHLDTMVLLRANIHSREPIRTLADLKGKVVGTNTATDANAMKLLGASATVIPQTELYASLERGVLDAVVCPWGAVTFMKLWEVAPYHIMVGMSPPALLWGMNRDTFEKFTPTEQFNLKMLGAWHTTAMIAFNTRNIATADEQYLQRPEQELIYWSPDDVAQLQEKFKPIWDEWAEEMEGLGYPGKEILSETIRFLSLYDRG